VEYTSPLDFSVVGKMRSNGVIRLVYTMDTAGALCYR